MTDMLLILGAVLVSGVLGYYLGYRHEATDQYKSGYDHGRHTERTQGRRQR